MLFAQQSLGPFWITMMVIVVAIVMILLSTLILLARQYKRCPSNRVLVIYGKAGKTGQAAKTIHGGAAFVWPLIQDYAFLSLDPVQIEIPLRGALSSENIRVNVPSVFTVAVGTEPEVMQQAAIRLLGLTTEEVRKQAEEIIFGQLRQVIASMGIEEINRDRDQFLEHIQSSLEPELNKIGLQLINVNITDITDESGYIDAIGKKAASQAIQQASADVAEEEKKGQTRVALAERDKFIQIADANRDQSIGTRKAERDTAVKIADLEKEQAIGERRADFERESQVKTDEQAMRVRVADAEAQAIEGENLAQATIAASQAQLAVRRAVAYEEGESRKKQAEAKVLEVQNRAMAEAALAEAERIEAEERAKMEAPAKAAKAKTIVDAEANAEQRRIEALAEADAIFAKLDAEARGQFEVLAKKGEGLREIVEACGGAKEAFQLLLLEKLETLAETSSKAIANIKFDKIIVWENGGKNGRTSTANFLNGMANTLPPMMQVMRDIGGVELPESLVRLSGEDELSTQQEGNGQAKAEAKPEAQSEAKPDEQSATDASAAENPVTGTSKAKPPATEDSPTPPTA